MRRQHTIVTLALALGLIFAAGQALAFSVVQGKCLESNNAQKTIKVEAYDTNFGPESPYGKSTGILTVYDVSEAKIGIPPQPGDILRIAYTVEGEKKKAAKVMNVSKQDLRKK
ncbi:hypothetical protein DesfrDRAFT_2060 [Solidesulfovibrio fructosivorans JJ]]|uniref:Uncharacterized protein n=1 Tax=Solidesulfovibrio fructosivorans JJ] TaxID=596151 RepID=E1JWR1_SOLFR|nr:hypothetical protein [Solidesulfovibrio fructosivorans]EFL51115.1 hypothetical protein DesfrDRAFT_2060 [Solidesulfovibrio fructosivorans JJ]]